MANIKYVGEAAVGRIADYVNKKLAFVSSMPESPETNTVILYIGADTSSYMQGGIYKYDGNNWILINNNVKQLSLTQEEYDLLPTSVQNNGTEYFVTNGVGLLENNIIQGYYNTTDGKFYRDSSFTIEITGNSQIIYIDLLTNKTYRYDSINIEYILIGGSSYENKPAQENGTDLSLVTTGEKYEWNKQVDWNQSDNTKKDYIKNKPNIPAPQINSDWTASSGVAEILHKPTLGTASALDVATSGNASTSQVVKGDDTRLTNARNAADVYSWAKESTKPTYTASEVGAIASTLKGAASGVAELDVNGKVPSAQLPSFVDDVIEAYYDLTTDRFYEESTFETLISPVEGKSWVDIPANKSYRWTGSVYVRVDEGVQLGETSDTAYAGNKGKANADAISAIKDGTNIDSFGDVETALSKKVDVNPLKYALKFSSDAAFTLSVGTKGWNGTIEYSTDNGSTWTTWTGSELSGTASQAIYLRGTGNTVIIGQLGRWTFTGKYCTGNIETLLDYNTVINGGHPTMANYCYKTMFNGCTSLTTAPTLPAMTLANYCYEAMFNGCTSLTTAPELPATTLAQRCYYSMFEGCTSLTTAPTLSATTLVYACYNSMFSGCTSLKLSTTQTGIYQYPFRIPTSGTGTTASDALKNMFYNTGGTFTGTPTINTTYYTDHPLMGNDEKDVVLPIDPTSAMITDYPVGSAWLVTQ